MAANVEKSPLIRFVNELDFKQIPVSVKRKKKEECPSGLILIDSNCELKKIESSSESSSGEEDELRVLMGVPNYQLTTNFWVNCQLTTNFSYLLTFIISQR